MVFLKPSFQLQWRSINETPAHFPLLHIPSNLTAAKKYCIARGSASFGWHEVHGWHRGVGNWNDRHPPALWSICKSVTYKWKEIHWHLWKWNIDLGLKWVYRYSPYSSPTRAVWKGRPGVWVLQCSPWCFFLAFCQSLVWRPCVWAELLLSGKSATELLLNFFPSEWHRWPHFEVRICTAECFKRSSAQRFANHLHWSTGKPNRSGAFSMSRHIPDCGLIVQHPRMKPVNWRSDSHTRLMR